MQDLLTQYLLRFVTERRAEQINLRLQNRTRYITVVLEDIFQSHNASAVLRSCECFGIQDVHIIENRNEYRINPDVALGSHKWLTLKRHNLQPENTRDALQALKDQGYRLVATSPHKKHCRLENFNLDAGKTALLFGSELEGLSSTAMHMADEFLQIPTVGFTESLNISVSAAICIHFLTFKLHQSNLDWKLTYEEMESLRLNWLKNTIRKADSLIEAYYKSRPEEPWDGIIKSDGPSD